uniref:Uncharacterized protein n=1 Tax=Geranium sibiricum TaxID=345237 RepID=A0A7T4XAK2_9ROSI|nr:hypothetical protein KQ467_pgp030 [Geranium sibiricum]QQD90265.1 hypothetical protein [Geranium sibiricum]
MEKPIRRYSSYSLRRNRRTRLHLGIRKGIIYVQASFSNPIVTITDGSGRVVVWASAGACGGEGEGRPGVDDRASEFQTESGGANADASTDDPNCQKDNDKIQTEDPNPKDSLPLGSIQIDQDKYIWAHPDGEMGGIDFSIFNPTFLHAHVMVDEEDFAAGLFEFNEEHLEEMRQFQKEKLEQTKEFNLRQRKKQLKHFFCFLFILAILGWRVFALVLGHASMDYLLHHSPYPRRIKLVINFVSRVGLLLQLVRTGSISFRESLKIFRVEIADLQRAIQSKSYLDPQALNFIQVLSKFIREYSRHAGIPLFEPIYNPLMALSVLVLWITLPTKKWKLPIMLIYSIFISLFLYYQFYWHFKGRFKLKRVDRRGRGRRRSAFPYNNKKWK